MEAFKNAPYSELQTLSERGSRGYDQTHIIFQTNSRGNIFLILSLLLSSICRGLLHVSSSHCVQFGGWEKPV